MSEQNYYKKVLLKFTMIDLLKFGNFTIERTKLDNDNFRLRHHGYKHTHIFEAQNVKLDKRNTPVIFINWNELTDEIYFEALHDALSKEILTNGLLFELKNTILADMLINYEQPLIRLNLNGAHTYYQNQPKYNGDGVVFTKFTKFEMI
jgi:hypothetical protein